MQLLNEPPCPKCRQPLPTRQLWDIAGYDRFGLLRDKSGIVCPQCGLQLKVIQWPVFLSFLLPALGIVALVGLFDHALIAIGANPKIVAILLMIPLFFFRLEYGPCLARVRKAKPDEVLVYPLSSTSWKNDYLD